MLLYREDNKKLYVNKGNEWDEIGSEKEVSFYGCLFKLSLKIVLSSGQIKQIELQAPYLHQSV